MDLVTAQLQKKPGTVIAALNYEAVASGYKRLSGFERYDGAASPSAASGYDVVHFTAGDTDLNSIVLGSKIGSSGTPSWRAYALGPAVIISGSAAGGDAVGYIGVSQVTTGLTPSGFLRFFGLGTVFGTFASVVPNEAVPEAANGAWNAAAISARRTNILAVPGAGPVRGVWAGDLYGLPSIIAVRDDASPATKGIMYSTTLSRPGVFSTWSAVNLAKTFTFNSGGTFEPIPTNVALGDTSGALGDIIGHTLSSGTWAAGTAAGTISIRVTSGAFQNGENISVTDGGPSGTGSHANDLTLTNAGTAISLPAGGSYEFITHNFFGASNLTRIYGVNGVGPAFEFDAGSVTLATISTGMTVDTPNHIAEHQGSLFLSFPGGSVQSSATGNPLSFDPILGAAEIAVGSDVTALASATKSALVILAENSINVLYGHDTADYQLEVLTDEAGALPFTVQKIGQLLYLDQGGLRSISASAAYGNFNFGSLSQAIEPLLRDKRRDAIDPVASFIIRRKTQYWLVFEDGTGIVAFLGRKQPEFMPFDIGLTVTCACSIEANGEERIFLGADDGYVYEFDVGTSFDGAVIEHYVRLPFNNFGSPQIEKRAHKVILELETPSTATLSLSVDFDYGSVVGLDPVSLSVTTGGGALDDLGSNELYYASQIETTAEAYVDGVAKSFSLKISGSTSTEQPHTLTAATWLISARGLKR